MVQLLKGKRGTLHSVHTSVMLSEIRVQIRAAPQKISLVRNLIWPAMHHVFVLAFTRSPSSHRLREFFQQIDGLSDQHQTINTG